MRCCPALKAKKIIRVVLVGGQKITEGLGLVQLGISKLQLSAANNVLEVARAQPYAFTAIVVLAPLQRTWSSEDSKNPGSGRNKGHETWVRP